MGTSNRPATAHTSGTRISRRTVARGAAWTAPLMAVGVAVPAFAVSPGSSCWDSTDVGRLDIRFVGPINTRNNVTFLNSADGTCTGSDVRAATVVQAPNYDAARDVCEVVAFTLNVQRLRDIGYASVPSDHYVCESAFP